MNMNECDKELKKKIDEHRKSVKCDHDCWCWSAQGTLCLLQSVIEANKLWVKINESYSDGNKT